MNIGKLQTGIAESFRQDSLGQTEQENMRTYRPKTGKEVSSKEQATPSGDTVSVSDIWRRVAQDVNVRNATPREIIALSTQLYKADAISYDDHINLSFQPEINPDSASESKSFSHERKDYISLWQGKQDNVIRFGGDRNQIEETHRIQAILRYVDSLK